MAKSTKSASTIEEAFKEIAGAGFLHGLKDVPEKDEVCERLKKLSCSARAALSKKVLKWLKWEPASFLGDEWVLLQDWEATGLYVRLLNQQWMEGSIPDNAALIARLTGGSIERAEAIWPIVREKFVPAPSGEEGRVVNPRLEATRDDALSLVLLKTLRGSKAARARWGLDEDSSDADSKGKA